MQLGRGVCQASGRGLRHGAVMPPFWTIQRIRHIAPTISSLRIPPGPILPIPPRRVLPPVDRSLGAKPRQAAKFLPLEKARRPGAKAMPAPAVTGPTPGAVHRRRISAFSCVFLRCVPKFVVQHFDLFRRQADLIEVGLGNLSDRIRLRGRVAGTSAAPFFRRLTNGFA